MAETADVVKNRILKAQNAFNTTAASSHHFKSTDTSNSKHKRSKTQNNVNILDSEISVVPRQVKKKEDALSQIKSEMKNLYEATADGKYKFLPNKKIVYVTSKQNRKKSNKRCNSTDGGTSQNFNVKRHKINGLSKQAKQTVVKNKNRKYFPAAKELFRNLNSSFWKEPANPKQEYMDQMKRKQRYTAFDVSHDRREISKEQRKANHSGKLSSFSGTYYHNNSKLI